jgi:ABC-type transport system involved in multi-copper enzyme maturation permease subunit
MFHICCISIHELLYFIFFSALFGVTFLSAGIATSISMSVFSLLLLLLLLLTCAIFATFQNSSSSASGVTLCEHLSLRHEVCTFLLSLNRATQQYLQSYEGSDEAQHIDLPYNTLFLFSAMFVSFTEFLERLRRHFEINNTHFESQFSRVLSAVY